MNVEERLHRLARLASEDMTKRFDRLYKEIEKEDFLFYAYEKIKGNRGSATPGIDGLTRFEWTEERTQSLSTQLRDGTYQPQPVRRVLIDKKNAPGKKRPLGIPTLADRVVQSAVRLILEALYEPIFMECSHGFRPHRACQTAIENIIDCPKVRIDWIIEGDIKGCFDNICHQKLILILQRRIKDDRFLKLIAKFLKAGYFERERWNPTKAGTPQGGIVSPILANIYLHELDAYVTSEFGANQESAQTYAERQERVNTEWTTVSGRIGYCRAMLAGKRNMQGSPEAIKEELRKLLTYKKKIPWVIKPIKPRVSYVRYADDFVIVLRNLSKERAESIKSKLSEWVSAELGLILSPEKTKITHITDGFIFLGYKIMARKDDTSQPKVKLVIPFESVNCKIKDLQNICKMIGESEHRIIVHMNNTIRGWMTYYRCATSPSRVMSYMLSQAWWTYARYMKQKHQCSVAFAAKRWMERAPASRLNPRGDQKTWYADEPTESGGIKRHYLVCSAVPKLTIRAVAHKIRYGWKMQKASKECSSERAVCSESCSHGSESR